MIEINNKKTKFSHFVTKDEENFSLILNVKGIHCFNCIKQIEKSLYSYKEVVLARVNMTTERLQITWKGSRKLGDVFASHIIKLGYELKPFSHGNYSLINVKEQNSLIKYIAISAFSWGNLMMISVSLWSSNNFDMGPATKGFFYWLSSIIAIPAILYSGIPFFKSALYALKQLRTNMDVPISLAIILTTLMSFTETIQRGEHIYFDSALMLIFFLLIGRYLDIRAKDKAKESAKTLLSLLVGTATVLKGGKQHSIMINKLDKGDEVLISLGENVPADGIVKSGTSDIDVSIITGETIPQFIKEGDKVIAGTLNMTSPIIIVVTKRTKENLISEIVKSLENSESVKSKYTKLADQAARLYTPIVHILGVITFLIWYLFLDYSWQNALLHAVTVLIITCPCALGLAVPIVQVLANGSLMREGILLKRGSALEKLSNIDTVVFDKTGTITLGKPNLINKISKRNLKYAASLAVYSKHPLSRAISRIYNDKLFKVENLKEIPGQGLQGIINNKKVRLGKNDYNVNKAVSNSNVLQIWLSIEDSKPLLISFKDHIREDAIQVVKNIKAYGIKIILLSGDRYDTVKEVANILDIKEFYFSHSIDMKRKFLENLEIKGHKVLMVGDGLNDAPSLSQAYVSMSPSTAIDITQNAADIVFQGNKLKPIFKIFKMSRYSSFLIKQNFIMAVLYNFIAIPLAIIGYVTPLIAAIAMSCSSIVVIINSFRINFKKDI
ncbi:MAG: cadmium-translocating P-type ATPase [Pelagibacterales bacterium]|jgi:Cu2+-exporting ATPase|nr:cadmium-translocating P-type ATPase [Pelagibacterales bacterium]MBT7077443.1 cadmium-translocating P-type ATPase [Pelagibacterales bacterium]